MKTIKIEYKEEEMPDGYDDSDLNDEDRFF
jgi:hypothetical protein